jgi:predicted  nucleic acid-binding Zn-ribbon protein
MTMYEQLLTVQEADTRLDQLAHRRDGLPERRQIAEADQVLATVDGQIEAQRATVDERRRAQRRVEDELAAQETRAKQIDTKLYGGTVSAARELQDLQGELDLVHQHISKIEDDGLVALDQLDQAQARLDELEAMRTEIIARRAQAETGLTVAAAEIDAESDGVRAARTAAIDGVPEELVAEYERLRATLGGVGIARLVGSQCEGCHLNLSAVELDRIRHLDDDEPVHCEECGRLLVRTRA